MTLQYIVIKIGDIRYKVKSFGGEIVNLEGDSNRLVWTVIGLGIAALIGGIAYLYFDTNTLTWLQQIGTVMTEVAQ